MVEVIVSRLGLDSGTQTYVVVLQEKSGSRVLPIWIGQAEAESIVLHMHNVKRTRPLTHDLCKSLILGLGGTLRQVQITRVEKNTYYAELHIDRDGGPVQIDARPSDSIAIALRLEAPIYAADALLMIQEESGEEDAASAPDLSEIEITGQDPHLTVEQLKAYLEQLRPEDFGKFNI
jgi:bifunctional DNase/RNase